MFARRSVLVLVLVAGCDLAAPGPLAPGDGLTDPGLLLDGSPWAAAEAVVHGERVSFPEPTFTATFDRARVGGAMALNGYGGRYAAGRDGSFAADEVVTTLIGLPPADERRSDAFGAVLTTATRFEVADGALFLTAPDGRALRLISADR